MTIIHRRFATAEAELANGFAAHATMGDEAMLTLGLDPAGVLAWADRHDPVPVTPSTSTDPRTDILETAKLTRHWDAHPAKLVEAAMRGLALSDDAAFSDAVATMVV
jgi:hypothetical protein